MEVAVAASWRAPSYSIVCRKAMLRPRWLKSVSPNCASYWCREMPGLFLLGVRPWRRAYTGWSDSVLPSLKARNSVQPFDRIKVFLSQRSDDVPRSLDLTK
jgi:hypothetical protein